jgi:hypothetical protein
MYSIGRYKRVRYELRSPVCVKGKGISGEFIMTTPEQNEFPLSVTTVVGPSGAKSFVTSTLPTSSAVLSEVAGILNEEAREVVEKIIIDCKASHARLTAVRIAAASLPRPASSRPLP